MTPSELKYQHEKAVPNCFFFSRDSMKFFGDTMKNYGVRSSKLVVEYIDGTYLDGEKRIIDVWELYRKKPVKHGLMTTQFFDKTTFEIVVHGDLVVD